MPIVQALSSDWAGASLQDTAKQMLAGSGQRIDGFGNSGNDAYVSVVGVQENRSDA